MHVRGKRNFSRELNYGALNSAVSFHGSIATVRTYRQYLTWKSFVSTWLVEGTTYWCQLGTLRAPKNFCQGGEVQTSSNIHTLYFCQGKRPVELNQRSDSWSIEKSTRSLSYTSKLHGHGRWLDRVCVVGAHNTYTTYICHVPNNE